MYKLGFEEAEEPEIKLPTFTESWRKQGSSWKTICYIDYAKDFDCVDFDCDFPQLQQTVENSYRDENTTPPYLPPE